MDLAIEQKADGGMSPPLLAPLLAAPAPPANGMQEYWDINGIPVQGDVNHNAAVPDDFSSLDASVDKGGKARWQRVLGYGLLSVILALAAYAAYLHFVEYRDIGSEIRALIDNSLGQEDEAADETAPEEPQREMQLATSDEQPPAQVDNLVSGNPYWHLPNAIIGKPLGQQRLWTAEEEETWRAGLAHRFSYQRWKTVQEVRQKRLKGSEQILWDALGDKKFWTRGYAAVGLAEIGIPIALQNLDAIMQEARSELVADFFERFTARCNPGQCFVLRQALRLMDAKGRLIALTGIANSKDQLRELYLVAATLDPDKRVQRWIRDYLAVKPIRPATFHELLPIAQGDASGDSLLAGVSMNARSTNNHKLQKAKAPAYELDLQTEEDIDKELDQLDRTTDSVEFYEAQPAIQEVNDPETFEYVE